MIFVFRTRTCVPGGLGGRSRGPRGGGPVVPGGGSRPKLQQPIPVTLYFRPFELASKFMSILMSIFGRFLVDLGGHVRSCWCLFRPKLVPEPSSNRLIFEKVNVHETSAGVVFGAFPGPQESTQNDPRSPQDGSKIVLDRFLLTLEFSFRFCIVFGSVLVPIWPPKWLPRGARELC